MSTYGPRIRRWLTILLTGPCSWLMIGCATRPPTPRLQGRVTGQGYYGPAQTTQHNSPELMLFLALSGGGTRAASLSFGVMEELRATPSTAGSGRSLLNEIDGISAVSGGSFTAAAYALHGEKLFAEYEDRFLKRNVQAALLLRTLNPLNWPWLWSGLAGRSDLAAAYYDRILFDGATFGDLPRDSRPYIVINATDVSTGARFEFTQGYFDLICADLARYPLSRAVAASSAVPIVLTPITLDNHGGECGDMQPLWMREALAREGSISQRAIYRARELASFGDSVSRPYLHLVDGGVSDNLGLRVILDALFINEAESAASADYARVRRIAIVLVNAEHRPKQSWDRRPIPPGILSLGVKSSSIPMARYSYETVELLREKLGQWKTLADARRGQQDSLEFYLIEISFDHLADEMERQYFLEQKTSFNLPLAAVDRLRKVGGRLLGESPEYRRLLTDLERDAQQSR